MSEADDALREMALNRGCRLVKSRRRKPGGDFGRYGLKDAASGRELLGFGPKGLTATAEEIERYLRGGEVAGWKRSLIAPVDKRFEPPKRKRREPPAEPARPKAKASKPARAERKLPKPAPKPKPAARPRPPKRAAEPEPKAPKLREAKPGDAEAIARLLDELGYKVKAADARRRIAALRKAGEPVVVAERDRRVIGCLSWHVTPVVHRPRPVGRITMLVVAEAERGNGIGTLLVAAAEERLRKRGCGLFEATSNMKRMRAHAFYRDLGFERTSYRFAKCLDR